MQQKWHFPLLMCASALLMLTWLTDTRVYYHDDEWLYMKIAEEMFDKAEYWIPLWLGEPAYYKPPMTYWLMMLFFPLGGDRLLLARLSIALCSLGTVWLLYLLGHKLYRTTEAGLLAGLLALTSLGFLSFGKIGMLEMPMALFMTGALYCFCRAWQDRSGQWAGAFWLITGASALIKGPITVLILGCTALLLLLGYGRWKPFLAKSAGIGGLFGLFFVALWPLALYFKGEFTRWFNFFIIGENFGKFADALQYPVGPFLLTILQWCLPWTFLLFAAIAWLLLRRRRLDFSFALPLLWALVTIAIHLLPDTKLAWYMFLVVAPCMLLVSGVDTQAGASRIWRVGLLATLGLFCVLGAVLAIPAWFLGLSHPAGPWLIGASLLFLLVVVLLWRDRLTPAVFGCLLAFYCVINAGTAISPPHLPPAPVVKTASGYSQIAVMRKQVYLYSYAFNKKVRQIVSPDQAIKVLEQKGMLLIGQQDWQKVLSQAPGLARQVTAVTHYRQWKEEVPPELIRQALTKGDLTMLQEEVWLVTP